VQAGELKKGDVPPPFTLKDLDGRRMDSRDLTGKVFSVHFFALWCEPCLEELPAIEKAAARYDGKGYRALLIAVEKREEPEKLRDFAKQRGLEIPLLYDRGGKLQKLYGIGGLPNNVIVGRDGTVRHAGKLPSSFSQKIAELVAEESP
jgi:peroxiredoxin